MELDARTCFRALTTRDSRFDGRFFTGVTSTGVFCRPVCPAPTPKRTNCRFFACAAAAQEAGFRPCLRCRPELAPGNRSWNGTSNTVRRALELIEDGALDGRNVGDLAERLGVGDRHLRRLFAEHLGTSPRAVAQTRRVLFAKQLIADTQLPMSRVALLAGFANVRRFNAAVSSLYGRPPRELRRGDARTRTSRVELQLAYRPPLAWEAMLAFLRRRAVAGLEVVTAGSWKRAVRVAGACGIVEVSQSDRADHLRVRIDLPQASGVWQAVRCVRRVFDLDADPKRIQDDLQRHPRLRALVRRAPGLRIPGAWEPFEVLVRAILGQQVSVQAATTLAGRLVARWGERLSQPQHGIEFTFPTPEALAEAPLAQIGLPATRAKTLREVSRALANGDIDAGTLRDPDALRRALLQVPGIGGWTAEYVALRACGDPDAFPASDLGLRQALGTSQRAAATQLVQHTAEAWRPWRGYAALYLWKELADAQEG